MAMAYVRTLVRNDGGELFYLAPDRGLMAVEIQGSPASFDHTAPKRLFTTKTKWMEIQPNGRSFAAAPGAQRFLLANATDEAQAAAITLVLNWTAVLGK